MIKWIKQKVTNVRNKTSIRKLNEHIILESDRLISYVTNNVDLSSYERELFNIKLLRLKLEAINYGIERILKHNESLDTVIKNLSFNFDNLVKLIFNKDCSYIGDINMDTSYLINNDGSNLLIQNKDIYTIFYNTFIKYWEKWDAIYKPRNNNDGMERFERTDGEYTLDISKAPIPRMIFNEHLCLTYWLYVKLLYNKQYINISSVHNVYCCSGYSTTVYGIDYTTRNLLSNKIYSYYFNNGVSIKSHSCTTDLKHRITFKDICKGTDNSNYKVFDHICKLTILHYLFNNNNKFYRANSETWDKLNEIYTCLIQDVIASSLDSELLLTVNKYLYKYNKSRDENYFKG